MKKYGTAQTFGFFSANCGGRKLRQPDGNNRSRAGATEPGRDNWSRGRATEAGAGTTRAEQEQPNGNNRKPRRNNRSRAGTTEAGREQPKPGGNSRQPGGNNRSRTGTTNREQPTGNTRTYGTDENTSPGDRKGRRDHRMSV